MDVAEFSSSLHFAKVRDFAYHSKHPLHYGVRNVKETDPEEVTQNPAWSSLTTTSDAANQPDTQLSEGASEANISHRNADDIYRRAVALFDFEPENSNEARLVEGQIMWISYRHGQGWLVSENLETGETGLVPEEYVQVLPENDGEWVDAS